MKAVILLFVIAVIVEALIEYLEPVFDLIEDERIKKAAKQCTAIILAEIFAFQLQAGLIAVLVTPLGVAVNATFDMIITGIFCSRGANYLSDVIRLIYNAGTKLKVDAEGNFWDILEAVSVNDDDDDAETDEEEEGDKDEPITEENED